MSNLETMIEEEAVMTPPMIAKKTSSNLGLCTAAQVTIRCQLF